MNNLETLGAFVYGYCTDFILNTAQLLGLSYYEINALLFVGLWPTLTVILLAITVYQSWALKKSARLIESNAASRT